MKAIDTYIIEKLHINKNVKSSTVDLAIVKNVEYLMQPKELTGEDVLKLQTVFSNRELDVSDAIEKCVDIIANLY